MRTGADPIPPTTWQRALGRLAGRASPSRVDRPFQVVSETPTAVSTGGGGPELAVLQYDLVVPYLSIGRRARTGAARLFVPQAASGPMPLIVAMHYELGLEGAAEYLEQGWAVLTPREGLNPLADAVNLNLALVQAGRQLPFADGQRIALVGGSAGGYVTLMVASEAFPLAAAAPLAPLVSLPYNIAYFACNLGAARCGAKSATGEDASAVPVFCSIAEAITGFAGFLGPLEENCQGWFANSPVGVLDLVTSPVLAAFSTADALVPINQASERFAIPPARGVFPPGFTFARRELVSLPAARRTFLQAAGRRAEVFRVALPEHLDKLWEPEPPGAGPAYTVPCLFSEQKTISIVVLDEGPPDPRLGHFKYRFRYSTVPFFKHWFARETPLASGQLTRRKLELLMRRFLGQDVEGIRGCEQPGAIPAAISRRNRAQREQMDVVAGLQAYRAGGPAHRERLAALYHRLPTPLQALNVGEACLHEDLSGGLAYHEAVLQHTSGDRQRAVALARMLLGDPTHRAYAERLPAGLRHLAQRG